MILIGILLSKEGIYLKAMDLTIYFEKVVRNFSRGCGFPCHLKEMYLRKLVNLGLPVCVVNEGDSWIYRVKKRFIAERWMPLQ